MGERRRIAAPPLDGYLAKVRRGILDLSEDEMADLAEQIRAQISAG